MVNCRGNQKIDTNKVEKIIGSKFQKIIDKTEIEGIIGRELQCAEDKTELELERQFGPGFGLINPFVGFDRPDILQIFDESLILQNFIPYTMMTNASHRRWGIEFKPKEIIEHLPNKIIKDVIDDKTKFKIPKHKIGILTGNSPESGMLLWKKINKNIRDNFGENHFLGDISFPEVIIESIPEMGLSMELDLRFKEVSEVVKKGITNLCERGATIVCIACNTTQFFSNKLKKICSEYNSTYVSIPEVTQKCLKEKNIEELDFLAINYVSNFENWSGFKNLVKNFNINLPEEEDIIKINEIAFMVKKKVVTGRAISQLRKLIDKSTKTKNVLLALTELSIILDSQKKIFKQSRKQYLDTLSILGEEIADIYTRDYLSVIKRSGEIGDI